MKVKKKIEKKKQVNILICKIIYSDMRWQIKIGLKRHTQG